MKNFKTYAFAALLTGALALPLASANAEGYTNKGASAETSASGAITSQIFKALDTDRSGSLSESEFDKYSEAPMGFDDADSNGDGKLTLSEVQSVPTAPTTTSSKHNSMTN